MYLTYVGCLALQYLCFVQAFVLRGESRCQFKLSGQAAPFRALHTLHPVWQMLQINEHSKKIFKPKPYKLWLLHGSFKPSLLYLYVKYIHICITCIIGTDIITNFDTDMSQIDHNVLVPGQWCVAWVRPLWLWTCWPSPAPSCWSATRRRCAAAWSARSTRGSSARVTTRGSSQTPSFPHTWRTRAPRDVAYIS